MANKKKSSASKEVAETISAYDAMYTKWRLIHALKGGTQAMRVAGESYLPMESKELPAAYEARLNRTFLFSAYTDAVENIVAKPFSRAVTLVNAEDLPEQLRGIEDDTDRTGTSLTQLARELLTTGIDHGLMHIWVDYPKTEAGNGNAPRLDEQREQGIRPLLIPVQPANMIGWRGTKNEITGAHQLTQVRMVEITDEVSGSYGVAEMTRIRVLNTDSFEVWRLDNDKNGYTKEDQGEYIGFEGVPIVTGYISRTGFMVARPALEDLAWLNLAHWQSSSDQRNILRFARTGLWFFSGISREELKKQKLSLGPSAYLAFKAKDAKAQVIEHSGSAIDAGQRDLDKLEQQMQILGLQPFFRLTGGATATEKLIDESRSETEIQSWIRIVEDLLYDAYKMAAKWIGKELPEKFGVNVYSNFILNALAERDLKMLLEMRMSGNLDEKTFIEEVKRRNLFADVTSSEEILERLASEGPNLGPMGGGEEEEEDED